MSPTLTEQNVLAAKPSKASAKAEITDHAARAIIDEEAARRIAKTEKLRLARLAHEAEQAQSAPAAAPVKKKAPAKRSKSSA